MMTACAAAFRATVATFEHKSVQTRISSAMLPAKNNFSKLMTGLFEECPASNKTLSKPYKHCQLSTVVNCMCLLVN